MQKIRIGVFGLGRGSTYFDNITNNDGEIVAICERDEKKIKEALDYLGNNTTGYEDFDEFIENLGTGIVSLVNAFMPEAIILGGSVSNEKEILTKPLEDFVNNHIYAKNIGIKVNIKPAEATGCAGIVGGKLLFE